MNPTAIIALIAGLAAISYFVGRRRAVSSASVAGVRLHSLPGTYGWYAALWVGLPGLVLVFLWMSFAPSVLEQLTLASLPPGMLSDSEAEVALLFNDIRNLAAGRMMASAETATLVAAAEHYASLKQSSQTLAALLVIALTGVFGVTALRRIRPELTARHSVERFLRIALFLSSTLAVLVTIGIVLSLIFESIRFFQQVPIGEFLFGTHWSPQTALRADQVGSSGSFGAIPVFVGTLLITAIAISVALPIGLMAAVYMAFYAGSKFRAVAKPALEVLAGIPTVVYGFFAALVVAPLIRSWGEAVGLDVASGSALAAGGIMGVMIIPYISSLSDDAITAVPQSLSDGSYALGATRSETIRQVILPAALPGIVAAFLLAVSRAIGETMIVVMAAGLAAHLTVNPFEAVTTVTVQIVTLLTGDQEFDSPKTLAAFALGLVLFIVTLILNLVAMRVVQKYREQYE